MREIFGYLPIFFKRPERFTVLEVLGDSLRATGFRVSFDEKRIEVGKTVSAHADQSSEIFLAALMARLAGKGGRKLILSADSRWASTIHSVVVLARDRPKAPIDDADLENRIAQGTWKLYDRERGRAAKKMKVTDLDVALTEVRAAGVKLDGHRVLNPAGFRAKTIELSLSQTFSPRSFIAAMKGRFPMERLALFSEGAVMVADVIRRATGRESFLLASVAEKSTNVSVVDGSTVVSLNSVSWGKGNFISSLADVFSVSANVAEELFRIYLIRQASPPVLKKIEESLSGEFDSFIGSLSAAISRYNPNAVYWYASFTLPEFIFSSSARYRSSARINFLPVNLDLFREDLGFTIQWGKGLLPDISAVPALSALLEFYFLPPDDALSRMARRHARWLMS